MKTLFQVPKVETVIGRMDFVLEQLSENNKKCQNYNS